MAQILAVALHISSRVLRTWLQDHTALLSLSHMMTSQSCPPRSPQPFPSWPQDPSLHPSLDTQGAGHRGSLAPAALPAEDVCCSLVRPWGAPVAWQVTTRGIVSPQVQGSSWLSCRTPLGSGRAKVPRVPTVPRVPRHSSHGAGLVPEVAVEPCPGSTVGLSCRHPVHVPVMDALVRSVPGTGDGDSWDLLQILLQVLLCSTQV